MDIDAFLAKFKYMEAKSPKIYAVKMVITLFWLKLGTNSVEYINGID